MNTAPTESIQMHDQDIRIPPVSWRDETKRAYTRKRVDHWDRFARNYRNWRGWGAYYQSRPQEVYQLHVPPSRSVLEIGCSDGDLLTSLKPSRGVGVDFSPEMVDLARQNHRELHFVQADAHSMKLNEQFDFVILSDLINDLWDVQAVLKNIRANTAPTTRIIFNSYSRLWELPLRLAQRFHLAKPMLSQNWLTVDDVSALLRLSASMPKYQCG